MSTKYTINGTALDATDDIGVQAMSLWDEPAMSPTLSQIAAAQGVIPLEDVRTLGGLLADDEVEDFISVIYESRQRNGRSVSAPPIAAQRIIGE